MLSSSKSSYISMLSSVYCLGSMFTNLYGVRASLYEHTWYCSSKNTYILNTICRHVEQSKFIFLNYMKCCLLIGQACFYLVHFRWPLIIAL